MTQKFYLQDATTGDTGTLPSASPVSAGGPSVTASGATTNRTLSPAIGSSQVSGALTTLAQTGAQTNWFRRFLSDPIAAQTIASQTITFSGAASQSSASSKLQIQFCLFVWRPSTGAKIGTICDPSFGATALAGTTETAVSTTATSTSQTAADQDVLVLEVQGFNIQTAATAFTNTLFYGGTTEASASNNAAFINFANDVAPYVPAATYPYGGAYYGAFRRLTEEVKRRFWRTGWERRPSGVLVPA